MRSRFLLSVSSAMVAALALCAATTPAFASNIAADPDASVQVATDAPATGAADDEAVVEGDGLPALDNTADDEGLQDNDLV